MSEEDKVIEEDNSRGEESLDFIEVIANKPPGNTYRVHGLFYPEHRGATGGRTMAKIYWPSVKLHCDNEHCKNTQFFDADIKSVELGDAHGGGHYKKKFIFDYICRHCKTTSKMYALQIEYQAVGKDEAFNRHGIVHKIGEVPAFGPHVPARLQRLIQSDRDLFLKGHKAESMNMGIAAFSYYRRVVENQKERLIGKLEDVARKVNSSEDVIEGLKKAKSQFQFKQSIDDIKPAIPESLLINGHNPLTLLHSALSEGLHADSDETCLELAQFIRMVLMELSEKMASALSEQKELNDAVNRLMQKKQKPQGKTPEDD